MKLGIVAHDAGAANHIFAWLKGGLIAVDAVEFAVAGPALTMLNQHIPGCVNHRPADLVTRIDQLLTGTSWPNPFEWQARQLAADSGIKSIAVLDHWTHYPQRFINNHKQQLPDELWVADHYAQTLAQQFFPDTLITLQPNYFLQQQVAEIKRYQTGMSTNPILFVMEPVPATWPNQTIPGELQALEYFLRYRHRLGLECQKTIVIRPHPADAPGKYAGLQNGYGDNVLIIDTQSSLSQAIARADWVVGCQTYAMVVALAAGKRVVCAMPDTAPPCVLPHSDIIHLRTLS